jgi:hypothetical protein
MKKIILIIIVFCFWSVSLMAQQIDKAEWFVDTDPGVGNGLLLANYMPVVDSISNSYTCNIAALNLLPGMHQLYVRARKTNGQWGLIQTQFFFVSPSGGAIISSAEYFFDTDPGIGNASALAITAISDSATFNSSINIGALAPGMHQLYVRMKANGQWGLTQTQFFFVSQGSGAIISSAEYFFDTDPGVGNASALSITAITDSATFNSSINIGALTPGMHQLYVRMKANGQWGLTQTQFFFVSQGIGAIISSAEYFFDTDPGVGNGTALSLTVANADTANFVNGINVGALIPGPHFLYVRMKANGRWGLTQTQPFQVIATAGPQTWVGEYFIDTDPGVGNGNAFSSLGSADTALYSGNINVGSLVGGPHTLYTRYKNATNQWGLADAKPFVVRPSIIAAEYFIDNDPGIGNGTSLSIVAAADTATATAAIAISGSGLSFGKHRIYTRFKNDNNQWGLAQRDSFVVLRPANDHCAGGSVLQIGNGACGAAFSSSTFATDTTGIPVGSCNTSTEQGDVWFKAVVPSNGNLEINVAQAATQTLKRGNIQAFTGLCNALTNVGCANFDSTGVGRLIMTGLTANDTIRIRIMGRDNRNGNFDICAFGFNNVLSVSANTLNICNGANTALSATAYSGNVFAWSPATGLSTTTGANVTASPTVTTKYYVTATLSNTVLNDSITITVAPLVITATASPNVICNGNSSTLSASGATAYTWMPGSLSGSSVSVSPSTTTIYTVTGTQGACIGTDTVHVNVFNDVIPPNITACASTVNVNNSPGNCYATGVVLGTPTATDNCTATGSLVITNDAPINFNVGATTVTWTVKDAALNQSTCTQTVNVTDNQQPSITCPGAINVNTNIGSCTATGVALGTPVTNDNCGVQSVTNNAPSVFPIGNTNVTWTVTDIHSNTNTCVQVVTVVDNQNPVITCPATANLTSGINTCGVLASSLLAATATDNCNITITNNAPTTLPIGSTLVKWYATDPSGNKDSCTQTVNVVDAALSITAGSTAIFCIGGSVTLTCNGSTGIQWYNGASPISGANAASYIVTATGNYHAKQIIGVCNRTSNAINVTVNPKPTVSAGADQTILQGSAASLIATGGGHYSWNTGNVNDTFATLNVSPIITTTYIVTVTNSFGCSAYDTVIVNVNFSSLSITPSTYNYGSVVVNTTVPQNISITNNGTLPVTINSITVPSPMSVSFTSQSINASATISVPVSFTPTATLIYSKTLVVNTSLGNFNVILTGTGVNAAPSWTITPSTYNFGNQTVSTTSSIYNFTLNNTGNVPINISSVTAANAVFAGSNILSFIPVGGSAPISATFTPTAVQSYSSTITVNTSTVGLAAKVVNVSGVGFLPGTPPVLNFLSAGPYNGISGVNLATGTPGAYTYQIKYSHPNGLAPATGYPTIGIDKNGDGDFIDGGEGIYSLTKIGVTSNWTTGEVYTYTTNLSIGATNGYKFFANDVNGNSANTVNAGYYNGPLVTNQTLDLSIYANDITFSMTNPAVNQVFTISATVHNNSPYSASNVNVRFYTDSIYFTQTTIPFIAANSTAQVSVNQSYNTDGWYPIKVWIDSVGVLGETNALNNYAIRPILVGNFSIPGAIVPTANTAISSCPIGAVQFYGGATYSGLNLTGTPPVLGGTVTLQIVGGPTLTTNTATDGSWSIYFNNNGFGIPCNTTFSYTVTITDYTLTATTTTLTYNVPCSNCGGTPGNPINPYLVTSGSTGGNCINANANFNYVVQLGNYGTATAYHDTTFVYANGNLTFTHVVDSLPVGQFLNYTDVFNLAAGNHTLSYTHVYYKANGTRLSISNNNNVTITTNLPDFILGSFTQTGATSFNVAIYNSSCTTAPITKVHIYDSIVGSSSYLLIDSFTTLSVIGSFNHIFQSKTLASLIQGYHNLRLKVDFNNVVAELNEGNNKIDVLFYVPQPELTVNSLTASSSNVVVGSSINFSANVVNNGATAGAFKVRFKVGNDTLGAKIVVSSLNSGSTMLLVSDPYIITLDSCPKKIYVIADIDNQLNELYEFNNADSISFATELTCGVSCPSTGSACSPYTIPVGTTLTAATQIANSGTRNAKNVILAYKLNGILLGTDVFANIGAGQALPSTITNTFNTVGNYVIQLTADTSNTNCELNEADNLGNIYVNVVTGLPDLKILSQDVSPSNLNPSPNQTITVVSSIHNTGTTQSTPTMVRFWVDNVQLGVDVPIGIIYPGQDTTVAATATYSSALVGPKIIKVTADPANTQVEINESNNEATRAIIVGAAPDMASSINQAIHFSPSIFRKGDTIQICNNIRNYGGIAGTAWMKFYFRATGSATLQLIDSIQFTRNDHDSADVCMSWIVPAISGTIVSHIYASNPPEFDLSNNDDSLNFTAGPTLKPSFVFSPNSLCVGLGTSAIKTIVDDGQPLTYQWILGSTVVSTSSNFALANTVFADSGNYYLKVTDAFGFRNSAIRKLTLKSYPNVNITGPILNVCAGANTTLTASGATSYLWLSSLQTTVSIIVNPIVNDTFMVTGTKNGCATTDTFILSVINCGVGVSIPTNDNPCSSFNGSGNSGSVANTTQVVSYDGGSVLFSGIANNPTANPPSAPNLVYYTGNTYLASSLGGNEPLPSCGTPGTSPKSVWYKFKAPTFGAFDIKVRTNYSNTNFNTILTAYTISGNVCGSPIFTAIPGACSINGTLPLSSTLLSSYAGQLISIQLMGNGSNSPVGNYILSLVAEAPPLSATTVTTSTATLSIPTISGMTSLKMYIKQVGSAGQVVYTLSGNPTSYTFGGLTSGSSYQAWASYSNGIQTFYTPTVQLTTTTGCSGPLAAPSEAAVMGHCAQRLISWPTHPLAAVSSPYRLYSWKPATTNIYVVALNTTSFTLSSLALNTAYNAYYKVICNGGAQVNSGVANYMTCAGPAKEENPVKEDFIVWHNGIQFVNPTIEDLSIIAEGVDLSDGQPHVVAANGLTEAPTATVKAATTSVSKEFVFEIVPNPNAGQFMIQLNENLKIEEELTISIFNASGSRVMTQKIRKPNNENQISLSLADYKEGVYLVTIQNAQFSQTKKMVIAR